MVSTVCVGDDEELGQLRSFVGKFDALSKEIATEHDEELY